MTVCAIYNMTVSLLVNTLHNMTGGVDNDCVAHYRGGEEWKCVFAPVRNLISLLRVFCFEICC